MSQPSGRPREGDGGRGTGPSSGDELAAHRRATIAKVVVGLVLLVLFLIFVIQNSEPVRVSFIFTDAEIALVWVFLGCAVFGGLIAYLVGRPGRRQMRRYIEQLEKQRPGGKPPAR
ncbi:MAG TPA: LapA family protein [Actinomycetota bacterium]|nr:LapA family protein [Actinomycetota bacterium]